MAQNGRTCGECTTCCSIHRIAGFEDEYVSPSRTSCKFQCSSPKGSCTAYEDRPQMCKDFDCSWLLGFGKDEWRPDQTGVMFTVKRQPQDNQRFGFAIEAWGGALRNGGRSAVVAFARKLPFPVIGASFEARPPDDTGDWVIVRKEHLERSKSMVGKLVEHLAEDVSMYELVKP